MTESEAGEYIELGQQVRDAALHKNNITNKLYEGTDLAVRAVDGSV